MPIRANGTFLSHNNHVQSQQHIHTNSISKFSKYKVSDAQLWNWKSLSKKQK